jgi:hypothetical protein
MSCGHAGRVTISTIIFLTFFLSFFFHYKQVYKKRTEVAKKEYLKALAAYRASLVSQVSEIHFFNYFSPRMCVVVIRSVSAIGARGAESLAASDTERERERVFLMKIP